MQIFQQEYDDGISEAIMANASVTYASLVEPCNNQGVVNSLRHIKSIASLDDQDLYYVQSILVTSNWNKNDDIFDSQEVWLARNTPEDKPTNLEHDESVIIGHITSNWPITEDGILIDQNTPLENLPEKFHILTGSVIYKAYSKPELKERSEKLIAEIENGTKYVSMECLFKGFDYGLLNKSTGEYKILSRNNDTAYLTKYLRAYGGFGEHQDYKIGRVLRNITFSGKGFVDKPANPESIIFTKDIFTQAFDSDLSEKNTILNNKGVIDSQSHIKVENNIMSLETQASEEVVEAEVVTTDTVVENTVEDTAESTVKLQELQSAMDMKTKELDALQATYESMKNQKEEEMAAMKTKWDEEQAMMKKQQEEMAMMMNKMKAELDTANETIAGYKTKEEEMNKKEKKMKRMASLVNMGIDNESAEATVDKFDSLDDEAFDAMTSLFAGKMPPWLNKDKKEEDDKKKEKEDTKASEIAADPEILETAEVDVDVNLSIGGEAEDSAETTRAALVEFVYSRLGKKLN
jgi:hypothetical protein